MPVINSALSPGLDVAGAIPLNANAESGTCFQGQTHGNEGFLLDADSGRGLSKSELAVVHPFLTGDDMLGTPESSPQRYVIDMNRCEDILAAQARPQSFDILRQRVMPTAQANAEAGGLYWPRCGAATNALSPMVEVLARSIRDDGRDC